MVMPFSNPSFFAAAAAAAAAAVKQQQFPPQPATLPSQPHPHTTAVQDKRKRDSGPVLSAAEEREARRRRNREASDRSRAKRRALLQSLPEQNAALEARVVELERGLSASQAEASALREQVSFLQTLLSNGGAKTSVAGTLGELTAAAAATSPTSPAVGAFLLAVVCVFSINNEDGFLVNEALSYFGEQNIDWPAGRVARGGRVLLSVDSADDHPTFPRIIFQVSALSVALFMAWSFLSWGLPRLASWTRKTTAGLPHWKKSHIL